jgi:predicted nucleotidyltransferase
MLQSREFRELLSILEKHEVRYLVIGGYAVMLYSEPRWTKDLDLWISTDPANARATFEALREFGAPLAGLEEEDFARPGHFYQMGNPPLRVDVMMDIPGGNFDAAWERRNTIELDGNRIHFIGREDLVAVKLASGRDQDLKDVESVQRKGETGSDG